MKNIPFIKATSFGNNFVLVDETQSRGLSETEKSRFAFQATNMNFGIGSDNFLVIQPSSLEILREINQERHYWNKLPDPSSTDFIFRMFEPDGEEALCCGNGLMCIANYLYDRYGIDSARVMVEIPAGAPRRMAIGTGGNDGTNWALMGHPRRVPDSLVDSSALLHLEGNLDFAKDIEVPFRSNDLTPFSCKNSLKLSGYLVFTGEPHWVINTDEGLSIGEIARMIFISSRRDDPKTKVLEKRVSFGSWLVHHIGSYVNKSLRDLFPGGININFLRIDPGRDILEYRTFERGINKETLACGTGALAVAYVVKHLELPDRNHFTVCPHRARWHEPDARIRVSENKEGWRIEGKPRLLFTGNYTLQRPRTQQVVPLRLMPRSYSKQQTPPLSKGARPERLS